MNTKQLTYPTIESQKQFWIDKEAQSNNATPETRRVYIEGDGTKMQLYVRSMGKLLAVTALFDSDDNANEYCENHRDEGVVATTGNLVFLANLHDHGTPAELAVSARTKVYLACPKSEQPTTADPKPEELSRTESLTDWYDHRDDSEDVGDGYERYNLRDEGRNPDGSGESYAERNV